MIDVEKYLRTLAETGFELNEPGGKPINGWIEYENKLLLLL